MEMEMYLIIINVLESRGNRTQCMVMANMVQ